MKQELIAELKAQLEKEKTSLHKELESFAVEDKNLKGNWDAKQVNAQDTDMEEKANEVTENENLLSLEYSLELRLKNVHSALEKIDAGTYGICEKCNKEIEPERLKAAPEAKTCMGCNK